MGGGRDDVTGGKKLTCKRSYHCAREKREQVNMKLRVRGITAVIDSSPAATKPTGGEKCWLIPSTLVDSLVHESGQPVYLEHHSDYSIGKVTSFYREYKEPLEREVLMADFEIDDESFITALKEAAISRLRIVPTAYTSEDGFVPEQVNEKDVKCDDCSAINMNAELALMEKFPAISLSHNKNSMRILELSLCLAGARDHTVITNVEFLKDSKGDKPVNEKEVKRYLSVIAGCLSTSNIDKTKKTTADLLDTKAPTACLTYSLGRTDPAVGKKPINDSPIGSKQSVITRMDRPQQYGSDDVRAQIERKLV